MFAFRLRSGNRLFSATSNFSSHLSAFRELAVANHEDPKLTVLASPSDVEMYTKCWRGKWGHDSRLDAIVLRPSKMETVQSFVKYSNSKGLRLVPQGGNTGLVGGGVPAEEGEVVMNTMRLNRSMSLDEEEGILTLDSGVVLQNAIDYCKERGFVYPVDLGAKGSCAVGGNVSSNAGGVYYNRFGSVSSNLIGLKAVLSTGEVLDLMGTTMRKNSAGFDLKQVFVGGEGNYGIVTKIAMRVHRMPTSRELVIVGVGDWDSVRKIARRAEERMGNLTSALEFMDGGVLDLVRDNLSVSAGWATGSPYYVLVETMGFDLANDRLAVEKFLEGLMEEGLVEDGVMAKGEDEIAEIWGVRESCGVAVNRMGGSWKYDVSLKLRDWDIVGRLVGERVKGLGGRLVTWGHLGDRNVHFNIVRDKDGGDMTNVLEPWIYEEVVKRGGSVSAEHGIGQCKGDLMERLILGDKGMDLMRGVKKVFDPNGIMNVGPGKMFE